MRSRRTQRFLELLDHLPPDVQRLATRSYRQFQADPSHPGLDFKQVSARGPTYSARIGIHYRALAIKQEDAWLWFWVGSHAEYDRLLSQL